MKKILIIILSIISITSHAFALDINCLFEFAKTEMKLSGSIKIPYIRLVNSDRLWSEWICRSVDDITILSDKLSAERLNEQLKYYRSELVGIFIHGSEIIYINNQLIGCALESKIVHEMVHYLQEYKEGIIDRKNKNRGDEYLYREMQAGLIEEKYFEQCNK